MATCSIRSEPPSYVSSVGGGSDAGRICALRESVEFEESISRFGGLRADTLGVDVGHLTASPERARSDSCKSWGRLSKGCVARDQPSVSGIAPVGARGAAWGYGLDCYASYEIWGMIAWSIPAVAWTWLASP
ncbi:hypothetical protein BHE74_00056438 [Ensete ventricosum]|nr:hypothetical protein BHE74_00056438 [Ensete ventricosum]